MKTNGLYFTRSRTGAVVPEQAEDLAAVEVEVQLIYGDHLRKQSLFECFPCVCPEPVLVKRSVLA